MTEGSLCTGYNGLGLAVEEVFGSELAWYSEIEPAPAEVMAVRYPSVPNLGDLTALNWEDVPPVDVLTAGYPCQPFSHAGKRKGTSDERHLWPHIASAVGVLRPRLVVLENVRGHLSLGFDIVLADLARMGYVGRWGVVRASDIGACHQRARLFVVAADADNGTQHGERSRPQPRQRSEAPADADSSPWDSTRGTGKEVHEPRAVKRLGRRGGVAWGDYAPAIARHEHALGRPAPNPTDSRGRLSPRFVEFMMMVPDGWVTDIVDNRNAALRVLGNGVVPPAATHALRTLIPAGWQT